MRLKSHAHILIGLTLGAALGAPPIPPLPGYAAVLVVALILRKLKLLRGGREALEYAGTLALSWVLAVSFIHQP